VDYYYTFVASEQDLASMNMVNYLRKNRGFSLSDSNVLQSNTYKNVKLYVSNKNLLDLENLDEIDFWNNKFSVYVFLSKHRSERGIPALTCHGTGNYGDNPYGGNPKQLAISYPYLQKRYLKEITTVKSTVPGYNIVIEATHHGPTSLKKPVLFVEIGSEYSQWVDRRASSVVCDCLLNISKNSLGQCKKVAIGLGGTHYPLKFNKLLLESEFGLAFIAAKHNLPSIDENMINQMIDKSIERITHMIIDWKGLGKEKNRIMKLIEHTKLSVMKV
jgi:D-aminoacyl-tRNA deacylase